MMIEPIQELTGFSMRSCRTDHPPYYLDDSLADFPRHPYRW